MKHENGGVAFEKFVGLTPECIHFWQKTIVNIEKKKA